MSFIETANRPACALPETRPLDATRGSYSARPASGGGPVGWYSLSVRRRPPDSDTDPPDHTRRSNTSFLVVKFVPRPFGASAPSGAQPSGNLVPGSRLMGYNRLEATVGSGERSGQSRPDGRAPPTADRQNQGRVPGPSVVPGLHRSPTVLEGRTGNRVHVQPTGSTEMKSWPA